MIHVLVDQNAVERVAQEWITERSYATSVDIHAPAPRGEKERVTDILRAAGMLAELSPEEKARAARSTLTLEEAQAILNRSGGQPLSELILEMRGSKA